MIEALVHFSGAQARTETYQILTYLRGEGYWQFLCMDGVLKIVPENSIDMVEIINMQAQQTPSKEEE
tara:strand:+ start:65 stop:265 length:201 start_codon:yes stop_codon:yes gene_type:complete